MRLSTTSCHEHGHREFTLDFDEKAVPVQFAQALVGMIELMVAGGSQFEPDQLFQVGWMQTRVAAMGDALTLHEPRMGIIPWEFVPEITQTLRHQMFQLFTLDSLAIPREQSDVPHVRMSALVCTRLNGSDQVVGFRSEPLNDTDSGWFFGCGHDDHDHDSPESLANVSLFEASIRCPQIVSYLGLPEGTAIHLAAGDRPEVFLNEEPLAIVPGSYLDTASLGS